ncbi:MAG TPA: Ig-like domain-containing protein [Thermoanaerobaculia bacterium]|jgi:hypothetical protein|nr:Ig-like domain-containing protein [Thermoanaerobaculia bacterium]
MRKLVPAVLFSCLALVPFAAAAAEIVHDNGDGTMTDTGTGLTWVADRAFAVRSGFAAGLVAPRAQALGLVAAMNSGAVENFGRTDWRLPTERELRRISGVLSLPSRPFGAARRGPALTGGGAEKAVLWPVSGSAVVSDLPAAAIVATNSVLIKRDSHVTGDVVVNDSSPGPTLSPGFELAVNRNSVVQGGLKADSVLLDQGGSISGGVSYNQLTNQGATTGALSTPLALPVFSMLPAFHTAAPRSGAPDVFVASSQTVSLPAGDYGTIEVAPFGTVVFTGGTYDVREIKTNAGSGGTCAFPCRSLAFAAPADVRVAERLDSGTNAFVGPASGSSATAASIIFYVGGIDGTTGALGSLPQAALFGRGSTVQANVYAPNGTTVLGRDSTTTGALLARDVLVEQGSTISADSYFANRPPIADPQTVFTNGAAPLVITLTGNDPEGGDLSFAIVTGPTEGSLGPITPLPPSPDPGEPGREPGPPAVRSATVTYTPATAGNLEDSFVFRVQDPLGASGLATVRINPEGQETPPPPPPDTVVAQDGSDSTFQDRPVTLTLTGAAPEGVALTFSIVAGSGPANGSLGPLTQGSEVPQRSATVVYTPGSGFTGSDGFQFEACGVIAGDTVCDTADVAIDVLPTPTEPGEIAADQTVTMLQDQVSQITFSASFPESFSTAARAFILAPKAAFLDGAEIAGNVADSDANGLGDNHNALPGSAPVFISAGVGQSGDAGSNGTVRIQVEWDLSGLQGIGTLTSASVLLHTHRGTVDSLDTSFFAVAGGDGLLTDSDFQSPGEAIAGAVMPVPPLSVLPLGADGTFSFDVIGPLRAAITAGASFFSIQGRVNESLTGPARGLEVRSTASGNLSSFLEPQLEITTPGVTPSPVFSIETLPAHGTLRDSLGNLINEVPMELSDDRVSYTPTTGFTGEDVFTFKATLGTLSDIGTITLRVISPDCQTNPEGCDDGR